MERPTPFRSWWLISWVIVGAPVTCVRNNPRTRRSSRAARKFVRAVIIGSNTGASSCVVGEAPSHCHENGRGAHARRDHGQIGDLRLVAIDLNGDAATRANTAGTFG